MINIKSLLIVLFILAALFGRTVRADHNAVHPFSASPGQWSFISVDISSQSGKFTPVLELYRQDELVQKCVLKEISLNGARTVIFPYLSSEYELTAQIVLKNKRSSMSLRRREIHPSSPSDTKSIWVCNDSGYSLNISDHDLAIPVEGMPHNFYQYEGVDAIIFADALNDESQLPDNLIVALSYWVYNGGILIFTQSKDSLFFLSHTPNAVVFSPASELYLKSLKTALLLKRYGKGSVVYAKNAKTSLTSLPEEIAELVKKKKLLTPYLRNPRLAPERYSILGNWPPRPMMPVKQIVLYIAVWLLIALCSLLFFQKKYGIIVIGISTIILLLFMPSPPVSNNRSVMFIHPNASQADELAKVEHMEVVRPFSGNAAYSAKTQYPMRPLSATERELRNTIITLNELNNGLWIVGAEINTGIDNPLPVVFSRSLLVQNQPFNQIKLSDAFVFSSNQQLYFKQAILNGNICKPQITGLGDPEHYRHKHFMQIYLDENYPPAGYELKAGTLNSSTENEMIIGYWELSTGND